MITMLRRRSGPPDCHQVALLLQAYLDAELDAVPRREVARHLQDCRRCGLEAKTYREVKASLRRRAPDPPAESVERVRQFVARLAAGEFDTVAVGDGERQP